MAYLEENSLLPDYELPLPEKRMYSGGRSLTVLFVYGTMMPNQHNEDRLNVPGARIIGPAVTSRRYTMRSKICMGGYYAPVLFPNGTHRVRGYLVEVNERVLQDIDFCEGHPFIYQRERITVDVYPYDCEAYLYGAPYDEKLSDFHVHYRPDEVYFDGNK